VCQIHSIEVFFRDEISRKFVCGDGGANDMGGKRESRERAGRGCVGYLFGLFIRVCLSLSLSLPLSLSLSLSLSTCLYVSVPVCV